VDNRNLVERIVVYSRRRKEDQDNSCDAGQECDEHYAGRITAKELDRAGLREILVSRLIATDSPRRKQNEYGLTALLWLRRSVISGAPVRNTQR